MNPAVPPASTHAGLLYRAWIPALGLLVCCLAISHQSFWIDEAGVAYKANLPTWAEFWHKISTEGTADLQQPLHHIYAWAWDKIFGIDEVALRAGNVPWFLLALILMARALEGAPLLRSTLAVAVLSSPFVWYYLNEARPYTIQISASLVVFSSAYRLLFMREAAASQRHWVTVFCIACVVLAASGMLAMMWLGAYLAAVALSGWKEGWQKFVRPYPLLWVFTVLALLAIGCFYLWTLSIGARATKVGTTSFKNVVFIPYELFGFSGLGPGRLAMRTGGLSSFRSSLSFLVPYGALLLLILAGAVQRLRGSASLRAVLVWALPFAIVAGMILSVGVAVRFRVLGRHCTPVLPLALFLVATGMGFWWKRPGIGKIVVGASVAATLVSCLELRFSDRHARDDYRGAANLGRAALARGERVWWSADKEAAVIYHLRVTEKPGDTNAALVVVNQPKPFGDDLPQPDVVLSSKPDLYDNQESLQDYLVRHGYSRAETLTAFTAWRARQK